VCIEELLFHAIIYICYRDERKKHPESTTVGKSEFSVNTSNASLRVHLDRYHCDAYEAFCKEHNCINQLPSYKLKAAETQVAGTGVRPRVKYTKHQFVKSLVNLVVGNDYVSVRHLWVPISH
jgi:hypothetical protein